MNSSNVETNVVEVETSELHAVSARQTQEAIIELNCSQLALIGGGTAVILLS
ncbi:MAG TPA: hypothetical protein VH183_11125 [Burkholderiaceae bacterium]|jgi:hypothetical protein|nr:hypothetical protein [Burkholderiaceae bacterium]